MNQKRKVISFLTVFFFVFASFFSGTGIIVQAETNDSYKANDEVTVIVQLNEKAAKDYNTGLTLEEAANDSLIVDKLLKSQEKYKEKVMKIDSNAIINRNYYVLLNGFSVKTKYKNIDKIKDIKGVTNVTIEKKYIYKPNMNYAKDITNVKNVWNNFKYKGEGMVVAIIDSGVDYTHKDMKISDGVEVKLNKGDVDKLGLKGKYFNNKIPYGYNYVDDNYDIIDEGSMHGMHVAGIVAANGKDEEVELGQAVKGVAPEAQLLAMKVFSNNPNSPYCYAEDVVAAIEDSVALGADVINMSLGGSAAFQDPDDPEYIAVKEATKHGVICVTAAGNASNSTTPYKFGDIVDTGVVDAPAITPEAFMIASCENNFNDYSAVNYTSEEENGLIAYTMVAADPMEVLNGEYELVECGQGRMPGDSEDNPEANDFEGKDLTGKIALIERGEINFSAKALNAENHGAVGAIIYNHENGGEEIFVMGGFGDTNTIPAMMIGHSYGEKLKEIINSGLKVTFKGDKVGYANPNKDDMSDFSSWGPAPNLDFKPEITAPGGDILSTVNADEYEIMGGTSMATPHTAGIMALIYQHIKYMHIKFSNEQEKVEFAKTIAMNTAVVRMDPLTGDEVPFSPRRMGAGFIDAEAAIENFVTVTETSTGKAAVALKEIKNNTKSFDLTLTNYGDKNIKYTVEDRSGVLTEQSEEFINGMSYDVKIEGAEVNFNKKGVITVPAGKKASIKVTLKLPEDMPENQFVEGFIGFEPKTEGAVSLGIPYMGFYGEWDEPIIVDLPAWDESCYWGETYLKNISEFGEDLPLGVVGQGEYGPEFDKDKIATNGNKIVLPNMTFFRNANRLLVNIVDKNDNVIRKISIDDKFSKNVFDDEEYTFDKPHWAWDGTVYNTANGKYEVVSDGQYYFDIKGIVDYEGAEYQSIKLPIKVDTKAPVIYDVKASNGKLSFKTEEDFSGVDSFVIKVENEIIKDAEGNIKRNIEADKNGIYTAEVDLAEGDELIVYALDYAGNIGKLEKKVEGIGEELSVVIDGFSNRADYEDGIRVNAKQISINGYVTEKVKVLKIMGKEVEVNTDLTFKTQVEFDNTGANKLKIYADSEDGDKCDYIYRVECDTEAPKVKLAGIDEDIDTSLVFVGENTNFYNVTGTVTDNYDGYRLFVNGDQVANAITYGTGEEIKKDFSSLVKLDGKYVSVIEIKAVDSFENETVKKILVMKDNSKVQEFEFDFDIDKSSKEVLTNVKVKEAENIAKVMVNNKECNLAENVFEGKVKLTEVNQIVITIIDKEGNQVVKLLPVQLLKRLILN